MKIFLILLTLLIASCASKPEVHPSGLTITEVKPDKWTALTKQNLFQLTQVYDLAPLLFTKKIKVQSQVVSEAHPHLILNTKNAEHPKKLLASFLHEEMHWWLLSHPNEKVLAIKDLKKLYPKAPVTRGYGVDSTYLRLIICFLEFKALTHYLGKTEARQLTNNLMKKDKLYPWIYYQVLNKNIALLKIIQKHNLIPKVLLETNKKPVTLAR